MADKKYSDTLFEALDIIINKRLEAVDKDKTVLCVIEDANKAEEGEYVVSNASAKFTAYSENTKYRNGQNVWVLIPEGNYNNEKKIIGKHIGDSSTPYVWVDPMDSFANMTGNVLTGNKDFDGIKNDGLVANYSAPVDIFTGLPIGPNREIRPNAPIGTQLDTKAIDLNKTNINPNISLAGYDRMGISAKFRTSFGSLDPIAGGYGLLFVIKTKIETETMPEKVKDDLIRDYEQALYEFKQAQEAELGHPIDETSLDGQIAIADFNFLWDKNNLTNQEYRYLTVALDSSKMWGNPYAYGVDFVQSIYFDIDPAINGTPIAIEGFFYQDYDFMNTDGPIPYYTANQYNADGTPDNTAGYSLLPANLFVKDINISFGYAVDKVEDDTIFLFTQNNDTYLVNNDDYTKLLETRFIYVGADNITRFATNNWENFNENLAKSEDFRALAPMVRWYRYKLKEGVHDARAGDFWEEFYPDYTLVGGTSNDKNKLKEGLFTKTINDLIDTQDERFKCFLCYNNNFAYYIRSYLKALAHENKTGSSAYKYHMGIWKWWYKDILHLDSPNSIEYNHNVETNNDAEGHLTSADIWQQWADSDQRIESNILIFKNGANAYDSTRDLVQGLKVEPIGSDKGVFNIYDATYGANNNLINPNDEHTTRRMKATFWSAVSEQEEMNEVERLAWYIPKRNTMIKKPKEGTDYHVYTKASLTANTYTNDGTYWMRARRYDLERTYDENAVYYLVNDRTGEGYKQDHMTSEQFYQAPRREYYVKTYTGGYVRATTVFESHETYYTLSNEIFLDDITDEIKNSYPEITDTEWEHFAKKIDDYYIIIDNEIDKTNKQAILFYHIKPTLKKIYTNNTIYASAYRYKRIYEGDNAHYALTFGIKGTSGTDYTLSLNIAEDYNGNTTFAYPAAWTLDDTTSLKVEAQLYDANDQEIDASYIWEFEYPSSYYIGDNKIWKTLETEAATTEHKAYAILKRGTGNLAPYMGAIIRCTASIANQVFIGYITVPIRASRNWIGMQGPTIVRYGSSGTGAKFLDLPYGLLDTQEKIHYYSNSLIRNYGDALIKTTGNTSTDVTLNYYPILRTGTDGHAHLKPKAMYDHGVNYAIYIKLTVDGEFRWANPILILIDPYGNNFLNNWGGELNIDYDGNTIMSAVMGAGKKENNNTFTGLLLGDLPRNNVQAANKTGLLGYEHGEQVYGIFDDGTMFLGKASTAQLNFNGTDGYIQNAGYGPRGYGTNDSSSNMNTNGIRINFSGATKQSTASMGDPYIHIRKVPQSNEDSGAEIYLNTGGHGPYGTPGWTNTYFMIRGSGKYNAPGGAVENNYTTWKPQNLLLIGDNDYYLQTEDYKANGTTGLKIDLKNGTFDSRGKLTINGASGSTLHFGNNNAYLEMGYNENGGYLTSTGKLELTGGTLGANESIYLGTTDKIGTIAGQENKTDWRLTIGSNFGVDSSGNVFARAGQIGDAILQDGNLLITKLYIEQLNNGVSFEPKRYLGYTPKPENFVTWVEIKATRGTERHNYLYSSPTSSTHGPESVTVTPEEAYLIAGQTWPAAVYPANNSGGVSSVIYDKYQGATDGVAAAIGEWNRSSSYGNVVIAGVPMVYKGMVESHSYQLLTGHMDISYISKITLNYKTRSGYVLSADNTATDASSVWE